MKILVYGAGNIGRLYAALLSQSGQNVSILARGKRLADIREHGIHLENTAMGKMTTTNVKTVEQLGPADNYDLVLVILPKNHVSQVLPILAANRQTPNVMFFGNNAAGPQEIIEMLGQSRVLLGFPGAGAVEYDQTTRYLILSSREQATTIGELDGTHSQRIKTIANTFKAAGFPVLICPNMDAWLKTHAAKIIPTANALYMAGADTHRLAHTRDALVLMLRAIREGFKVLTANSIPITPKNHRIFQWLPKPLLLLLMRQMIKSNTTSIKIGHALAARNEMKTLAKEFDQLIQKTNIPTPAIKTLNRYLEPQTEPVSGGNSKTSINL